MATPSPEVFGICICAVALCLVYIIRLLFSFCFSVFVTFWCFTLIVFCLQCHLTLADIDIGVGTDAENW